MLKRKLAKSRDASNGKEMVDKKLRDEENSEKSKYFTNSESCSDNLDNIDDAVLKVQIVLNNNLRALKFRGPVDYVYNPVEYAFKCNEAYIRKYCNTTKKLLFVGMNPGPFGMVQTGVPFGEINSVRDWLKIQAEVSKPPSECPERPVVGFDCTRSEISGHRLWNLFKDICNTPDNFFCNAFVYNYCPLAFLKSNGGNVTPSELKNAKELEAICDQSYLEIIKILQPKIVICIGRYVEKRTKIVLKDSGLETEVLFMPHPSPRAVGNQNWPDKARAFLVENDLIKYISA